MESPTDQLNHIRNKLYTRIIHYIDNNDLENDDCQRLIKLHAILTKQSSTQPTTTLQSQFEASL